MGAWEILRDIRKSRKTITCVVIGAMILDNFLLTAIVPILPVVLLGICQGNNMSTRNVHNMTVYGENDTAEVGEASGDARSFTECERAVNTNLGLLLASQFVVRILITPFAGWLCNKLGYSLLMLIGCLLMIASSVVYALADSYMLYLIGRLIHGIAAVPNEVGGMGIIAYRYQDDDEQRGFILGLLICGFAVGSLVGPTFGGVVSNQMGTAAPFIFLAGLMILVAIAEIAVFERTLDEKKEDPTTVLKLLKDPFFLIAVGALTVASVVFGLLEPALPVWMIKTMGSEKWQLGVVFVPSGLCYVIACALFGYFSYNIGRWFCLAASLFSLSVCIAMVPFATSFPKLIAPMAVLGFSFGVIDSVSIGIMFYIVCHRHNGAYGSAGSVNAFSFSIGFIVGPSLSSALLNLIGFAWLLRGLGIVGALFVPLCFCLRGSDSAPPCDEKEEQMLILPAMKTPKTVLCKMTS